MRKGEEESQEWLARVAREAHDPAVRQLAQHNLDSWNGLLDSWKRRGVKTRRALWDILAGLLQVGPFGYHWNAVSTTVKSGEDVFHFIILAEACNYRGRAHPVGAIRTGVAPKAHRTVQKAKWGNDVLKT